MFFCMDVYKSSHFWLFICKSVFVLLIWIAPPNILGRAYEYCMIACMFMCVKRILSASESLCARIYMRMLYFDCLPRTKTRVCCMYSQKGRTKHHHGYPDSLDSHIHSRKMPISPILGKKIPYFLKFLTKS